MKDDLFIVLHFRFKILTQYLSIVKLLDFEYLCLNI